MKIKTLRAYVLEHATRAWSRVGSRTEEGRATTYWRNLRHYHPITETEPTGFERSNWLADELLPKLGIESLLEVGTNTGRNLAVIKQRHPHIRVCGIDVNKRALSSGRELHPEVEFRLSDANHWDEPADSWDAILTMSVLDHIPDQAVERVAMNIVRSARKYVICVELWDGEDATRGLYKYSRDTRRLFERHGLQTVHWEESPGQYDRSASLLWAYVGAVDGAVVE